jgi:hypothetical protein
MLEPTNDVDDEYFRWLCAKVLDPTDQNYRSLLYILLSTEFICKVAEDDNRLQDGLEIRHEYVRVTGRHIPQDWIDMPCSVLEVLMGFSHIASFETDDTPRYWFWKFIENLELGECRRVPDEATERYIRDVLYKFLNRLYQDNGYGGLFPIRYPRQDQRGVEIWYQFCEYVEDQQLV